MLQAYNIKHFPTQAFFDGVDFGEGPARRACGAPDGKPRAVLEQSMTVNPCLAMTPLIGVAVVADRKQS